ncbi:L-2-amino-thiazoline-4-carboxylic acid hydrolase [Chelatococcus reniformis]|uniref:L-2-amino-thiazoline-4-carboxylic acid hydrolase n=1 Tax=Chelatococcus reniformis TaxID=1494448 RepID=A0A916U1A9_9HYPH|nr:L-2-amino-thiazoline-4-carboxylic acid hydrolase [Chelatococcus reniformis]GGC52577.1 hypothetical protein GCM10010994_09570 [Chelatococcus reniformis]
MSAFLGGEIERQIDDMVAVVRAVAPAVDAARLSQRVRDGYDVAYRSNAYRQRTEQDAFLLSLCCIVLACWRALREALGSDARALVILRQSFVEPRRAHVREWLASRMKITREDAGHAFERAAENFKSGGEAVFGESFAYVQEVQDGERSFVNVERCFFNDFFRGNGAPQVTPVFCALDTVWADELNAGPYNVTFERPSVLSSGADRCRFQFHRRP